MSHAEDVMRYASDAISAARDLAELMDGSGPDLDELVEMLQRIHDRAKEQFDAEEWANHPGRSPVRGGDGPPLGWRG